VDSRQFLTALLGRTNAICSGIPIRWKRSRGFLLERITSCSKDNPGDTWNFVFVEPCLATGREPASPLRRYASGIYSESKAISSLHERYIAGKEDSKSIFELVIVDRNRLGQPVRQH
jgi:hypothetical protein